MKTKLHLPAVAAAAAEVLNDDGDDSSADAFDEMRRISTRGLGTIHVCGYVHCHRHYCVAYTIYTRTHARGAINNVK